MLRFSVETALLKGRSELEKSRHDVTDPRQAAFDRMNEEVRYGPTGS